MPASCASLVVVALQALAIAVAQPAGAPTRVLLYDDMEVGLSRALGAYDILDALLFDELDEIVDHWRIDTTGFVAARSTQGCSVE